MMRAWSAIVKVLAWSVGLTTGYGIAFVTCPTRPDFIEEGEQVKGFQEFFKGQIREHAKELKELEEQERRQSQ